MNISFTIESGHLTDSLSLKIICGISFCFAQIISIICYSGFFYYEYYGGDPMKRTIKNYIIAQFSVMGIIICFTGAGYTWRVIIGDY